VAGPLTGSWEGLGRDVIVCPWHCENREAGLEFFATREEFRPGDE
jgi:hypothetical protein